MGQVTPIRPTEVSVPARLESVVCKTGEAQQLAAAMGDKLIRLATVDEVKEVLRYAMMKLGLREKNIPVGIEKMLLINHIEQLYGGHTLEEIRLAFDMAISGKLDVDPNCYENFSCEYFSRILKSYRKWAAQEYRELPTPPAPVIEFKENLSDEAMEQWLLQEIQYVNTGKPFEFLPGMLYDYLDKKGEITASKEDKRGYLERAVVWRQIELQKEFETKGSADNFRKLSSFRQMRDVGCFTGPEIDKLKTLAKKMLLYDLLKIDPQ